MGMVKETKCPLTSKSSALFPFSMSLSPLLLLSSLLTSNNIGDLTDTEHTGGLSIWRKGSAMAQVWCRSSPLLGAVMTHRHKAQCASSS